MLYDPSYFGKIINMYVNFWLQLYLNINILYYIYTTYNKYTDTHTLRKAA